MQALNAIRGYLISGIILTVVAFGLLSQTRGRVGALATTLAAAGAAACGVGLFVILSLIPGWNEFFASKDPAGSSADYTGPYQGVARFIRFLGSLDASSLGLFFGAFGLISAFVAYRTFVKYRRM